MKSGKIFALTALLATIWGVTYMHDRAHRYDIVAAGAGSGGTQDHAGETEIRAFIIDHQTGKVWVSAGTPTVFMGAPVTRWPCSAAKSNPPFSMFGCSDSAAQEIVKK